MSIISSLIDHLHNQFLSGGLLLMLTGSVLALARSLPGKIGGWAKRRITSEVEIINNDPLFDYVTFWLDAQPYSRKSRRLTATTKINVSLLKDSNEDSDLPAAPSGKARTNTQLFFSPAPGTHFFLFNGRLLKLERNRSENKPSGSQGDHSSTTTSFRERESYSITVFGRKQELLRSLMQEIVRFGSAPQIGTKLYYSTYGYWQSVGRAQLRSIESVILPAGVTEDLLSDIREFLSKESWYRQIGIPYHRGYLFFGIHGGGKSSLVAALAGELGMDLYLLNIGGSGMNDERLSNLMADIRPGCMLLMEDADCTVPDRESAANPNRVTLSGLLNCLDGIMSREGCLIFMTTNFVEKLDEALVRPGRIDYRLEFGYATEDQKARLAARIGGTVPEGQMTMAEVQQALLSGAKEKAATI